MKITKIIFHRHGDFGCIHFLIHFWSVTEIENEFIIFTPIIIMCKILF